MTAALITGGSGGIGEAFARRLAAEGFDLFLTARNEDKLMSICSDLERNYGISANFFAADLTNTETPGALFEFAEKNNIRVDWLINNAGFGSMGDFVSLDLENELNMIKLNVSSLAALTHLFLPQMRKNGNGVVINVSSAAGFQPIPFMATYAATKAFVSSFSEAIAEENRPFGITVLALCPGPTETNFFDAAKMDAESTAIKIPQTADEVVETALRAIKRKRTKILSGWTNFLVGTLASITPNFFIVRAVSKKLRSKYQISD